MIDKSEDELTKVALLAELKRLGFHESGRKIRNDRNTNHNYPQDRQPRSNNCQERADKGKTHNMSKERADKGKTHNMSKERVRSDAGQKHIMTKERSDKGKTHNMSKGRDDMGSTHIMTKPVRSDANRAHNYDNLSSDFYHAQFQKALQATAIRNHLGEIVGEGATRDRNGLFDLKITHKWKTVTKADGTTYKTKTRLNKPLEQYRWEWLRAKAKEGDPSLMCAMYHIHPNEWEMWTFSEWANAYLEVSEGGDALYTIIPYFDSDGQPIRYNNVYDKLNVEGE